MRSKKPANSARPSKRKSDIELLGGEVFAIPLGPLGFCTGVVSRPPQIETGLIHVYLRLENTKTPFKPDTIGLPHTWPSAWIGLLTRKSLVSGRWSIVGTLKNFDREAFPIPPTRQESNRTGKPDAPDDLFSIETTLDEPSLSPIDNISASRPEAMRFPPLNIIIAGSSLEKSLVRFIRKMGFTFHDIPIDGHVVGPRDVAHWNAHSKKIRASANPSSLKWLPAGSKTDRDAKAGDWFGFPMIGGGFGAAILLERPEKHLRVFADSIMLSMRRRWEIWPTLNDVENLRAEDGAIIRQMSLITVRDGRWRGLGPHPDFDKSDWPWPLKWHLEPNDAKKTLVRLQFGLGDYRYARIDRKIIVDPHAGHTISIMSAGDSIALDTYRVIEKIRISLSFGERVDPGIVTPQRISAWKVMNPAILEAMKRAVKQKEKA